MKGVPSAEYRAPSSEEAVERTVAVVESPWRDPNVERFVRISAAGLRRKREREKEVEAG